MGSFAWVIREIIRALLITRRIWLWWQSRAGLRITFVEVGGRERFTLPEHLSPRRGEISRPELVAILELCGASRFQYVLAIFLPGGSWENVVYGKVLELVIPCTHAELRALVAHFEQPDPEADYSI